MRKKFSVTIDVPDGVSVDDVKTYIHDAVTSWRGSLQPMVDPLFDLDPDKMRVTLLRKKKKNASQNVG